MSSRETKEDTGYVLRCRPFMENAQIVDLFTLECGRLSAIVKGSRKPGRNRKVSTVARLQAFQSFALSIQLKPGLARLRGYDEQPVKQSDGRFLSGRALYSGMYINELLMRLLAEHETHKALFETYVETLDALASTTDFEPILRRFENILLSSIGYGITWTIDARDGSNIDSKKSYNFLPEDGFYKSEKLTSKNIPGDIILAINKGHFNIAGTRQVAKTIMRSAIARHLGGKPLYSRKFFS